MVLTTTPGGRPDNPHFADEGTPRWESQLSSQLRPQIFQFPPLHLLASLPGSEGRVMEETGNRTGSLGQMRDKHHRHPQQQNVWLLVLYVGRCEPQLSS